MKLANWSHSQGDWELELKFLLFESLWGIKMHFEAIGSHVLLHVDQKSKESL